MIRDKRLKFGLLATYHIEHDYGLFYSSARCLPSSWCCTPIHTTKIDRDEADDILHPHCSLRKIPQSVYEIEDWEDLLIILLQSITTISLFVRQCFVFSAVGASIHPRWITAKHIVNCTQRTFFFVRCHNHKRTEIVFFTILVHWFHSFFQYFKHFFLSKLDDCMIKVCLGG